AAGEALERLAAPLTLAMDAMVRELELQRRRAHERMLATALATLADPVLLLDDRGRIRGANAAARETYGYSGAELLEMKLSQLVVKAPASGEALPATSVRPHLLPNETPAFTPVVDSVFRIRQEHRRKDGSAFPASLVRAPVVDAAGRPAGEVVLVRELTNEQRMEAHLRQHDRLAALGELVAGVAHELNNPLTGISAFAQLLLEDPLSEEQLESVRLVKREADRATAVVRDLLLFSRNTGSRLAALDLND